MKKLSQLDLDELRKRQELINQHFLIANSLKDNLQNWINTKLKEYGVEEGKKFDVSLFDGKIKESK